MLGAQEEHEAIPVGALRLLGKGVGSASLAVAAGLAVAMVEEIPHSELLRLLLFVEKKEVAARLPHPDH